MSLVADYSDSESDEEIVASNNDNETTCDNERGELGELKRKNTEQENTEDSYAQLKRSSSNFLVADSESSESETDLDAEERGIQNRVKLDNPFRTLGGTTSVSKEDSVFRNPFRDKEEEKIAVLEHHVKMTDNPETSLTINGKKICWNYRKRKCYLGTQCPYAHDSDVPLTEEQLKEQKLEEDLHRLAAGGLKNNFNMSNTKTHLPGTASVVAGGYDSAAFYSSPHLSGSHRNNTTGTNNGAAEFSQQPYSKSKKRVGLTNSLIPPKKALNLYKKTKDT